MTSKLYKTKPITKNQRTKANKCKFNRAHKMMINKSNKSNNKCKRKSMNNKTINKSNQI